MRDWTTTLKAIYDQGAEGEKWLNLLSSLYEEYRDTAQVSIHHILNSLNLEDALWALRCVEGKDKEIRLLACNYAYHVLHVFEDEHPDDDRPRMMIEFSCAYARGEATREELINARNNNIGIHGHALYSAAGFAFKAAFYSTLVHSGRALVDTAGAARQATTWKTWRAERDWQEMKLREMIQATST